MKDAIRLAVIAGSGFYNMPGLIQKEEYYPETPFGYPSAPLLIGELEGKRIAFLARHGIGHHILPGEVNYRANIYSLKMLGINRVIAVNACGSLRDDYAPGELVIPDQIYDQTRGRATTFFGNGIVGHVGVADPFCPWLAGQLATNLIHTSAVVHTGGTFIIIEGPRFSTKAESQTYRSWGMSIIGMTAAPEAFLAREAGLCYVTIAHVTDYDVWHTDNSPVTVEMVLETLRTNTHLIQTGIRHIIANLPVNSTCECHKSLEHAIITDPKVVPDAVSDRLGLLQIKAR